MLVVSNEQAPKCTLPPFLGIKDRDNRRCTLEGYVFSSLLATVGAQLRSKLGFLQLLLLLLGQLVCLADDGLDDLLLLCGEVFRDIAVDLRRVLLAVWSLLAGILTSFCFDLRIRELFNNP